MPRWKFRGIKNKGQKGKAHPPGGIPRNYSRYNQLNTKLIDTKIIPSNGHLEYILDVDSESNDPMVRDEKNRIVTRSGKYRVRFVLKNIPMQNEPKADYKGIKHSRKDWFYKVPNLKTEQMRVYCSCPDFRHVGEHAMADLGLLAATNKRRYERKTLPPEHPEVGGDKNSKSSIRYVGRGPRTTVDYNGRGALDRESKLRTARAHRNPRGTPIMCKHIISAVNDLIANDLLRGIIDK